MQSPIELKFLPFALDLTDDEINQLIGRFKHYVGVNLALRLSVIREAHSQQINLCGIFAMHWRMDN
jgi:hypothetical protein